MKKILLYYHTLKYLKFKQIRYRAYYALRVRWRKLTKFKYDFNSEKAFTTNSLTLLPSIPNYTSFFPDNSFSFLNLEKIFNDNIDWNYNEYGKLWTYNLTYFEYLNQKELDPEIGVQLIRDFIQKIDTTKDGLEPFPISLRIMNWVKFLTKNNIQDSKIDQSLYIQTEILIDKLEYHLLGNHLLENGFALLFAAYYFSDENFYEKAATIFWSELKEQILADGAHFELSPMYHCLMLYRVLDCINLMQQNQDIQFKKHMELEIAILTSASVMLGWLKKMTFKNGQIPRLNDTAEGIAPSSQQLFDYAKRLLLTPPEISFTESGYRKFQFADYECIVDVGHIGPDYIPGHAHSDTFHFVIHAKGQPFIVDTGISTYENDENRQRERSTSAHNTVQIGEVEQSEVWGGFRVARRAKICDLNEAKNTIKASHTGYAHIGATHAREFVFSEKKIDIKDSVQSKKNATAQAFIHFHPDVDVRLEGEKIITDLGVLTVQNCVNIDVEKYLYADGFNKRRESTRIILTFEGELTTTILT